jgi:hypothetical protein
MKQYKNFSFIGATQGLRTHQPEANLPTARKIENLYVSRSDGALTLRPDLWRFRDDIHEIGSLLQSTNEYYALNTIITSDTEDRNAFIMSHAPTGIGVEITSNYYSDGTVTTDGAHASVTGLGTLWKDLIWPECIIEFTGSTNLYKILGVNSDTSLTLDAIPAAHAGVTYKIYRTHDSTRGRYPVHVERFNNQYIYCASSPRTEANETISGPFTSDGDFISSTTSTTTTTYRTSVVIATVGGVDVPKFQKVAYLNSQWVGMANKDVWVSADRKNWTKKAETPEYLGSISADAPSTFITYGGGYYVFLCTKWQDSTLVVKIYRSTDLMTWSYSEAGLPEVVATIGAGVIPPLVLPGTVYPAIIDNLSGYDIAGSRLTCRDIIYAGSKFVGVGQVGVWGSVTVTFHYETPNWIRHYTQVVHFEYHRPLVLTSTDALQWTSVDAGTAFDGESFNSISYGNSKYICEMNGSFAHSTNTTSWTEVPFPAGMSGVSRFAFGAALYVAVGTGANGHAYISSSPDITTWTTRTVPAETIATAYPYFDVLFDGTNFVAIGDGTIDQSTNGTSWTNRINSLSGMRTVANNTNYLLASGFLYTYYSDNGTTWTNASTNTVLFKAIASTSNATASVISGRTSSTEPDTIVAVGETTLGYVYRSTDGITFSPVALADVNHRNDIIWNGSIFITVGDGGKIDTSPDGLHWTSQTSGSTANLYGVTYRSTLGSELFVAVGAVDAGDAVILTSPDATTWTLRTSGEATDDLYTVAYGNSLYVAGGENGILYTSPDGTAWTKGLTNAQSIRKIFYDGSYFYLAGDSGLFARSTNGVYDPAASTGFTESGDALSYLSEWLFTGATTANTTGGYVYWNYTYTPPVILPPAAEIRLVEVYSDAAKTSLIASGSRDGAGSITLAEQGGSGLSGTVSVASGATTTITDASQTIHIHWAYPYSFSETEDMLAFYSNGTNAVIGGETGFLRLVILSEYATTALDDDYTGVPTAASITGMTWADSYDRMYCVAGNMIFSMTYDIGGTTSVTVVSAVPGDGWIPLSEIYRAACYTTVDGYVLLGNINELENGAWKHYGQRIRWTSPGTYNDFSSEGSGLADLLGLGVGDIVDMRTIGHNVIVFMENGIAVLSPTGMIDLPFELRIIAEKISPISNPVVVDDSVLFIATDGLLYQVNASSCQAVTSQFDITEFSDFDPNLVTQLVHDRTLNVLFCYQPDATGDHRVFVINPVTWSVSYFNVPEVEDAFVTNASYPRAVVQSISTHSIPSQDPQRETLP